MKCAYCGKNNKPGALVCKRCGIALPVQPPMKDSFNSNSSDMVELGTVIEDAPSSTGKPAKKLKLNKKTALAATLAVLGIALVAALIIIIAVNSSNIILPGRNSYTVRSYAFHSYKTGSVFYGGASVDPDGSGVNDAVSSLDGTSVALLTFDGDLYSCAGGVNTLVAKNAVSFTVSANGTHILYIDDSGLLWRFDCKKTSNAPECICNDTVSGGFGVSPDGKSVLFVKASDNTLYANVNGKIRTIGEGYTPLSISDGGRHIYCYCPRDNSFNYVNKRGNISFLRSNNDREVYLNSRHDEIIFYTDPGDGRRFTLISTGSGDVKEIFSSDTYFTVEPLLPVSGLTLEDSITEFKVKTCPFKSFDKKLFYGCSLLRYDFVSGSEKYSLKQIKYACASDNYSTVFFIDNNGALYKTSARSDGEQELICDNAVSFSLSANGRIVWYKTAWKELHYLSGDTDRLVAANVFDYAVLPSGSSALITLSDDTRLYCNRNGQPRQTYVYENIEAALIDSDAKGLYYCTFEGDWIKLTNGGKRTDISK